MSIAELASLLKLGFSGFAAAMALLCYRLIHLQSTTKAPNGKILNSLRSFSRYTLYLSLAVIISTTIDACVGYFTQRETRHAIAVSKQAQDCRENLTGLIGAEGTSGPPEERRQAALLVYQSCFTVMEDLEGLK